MNYKKNIILFHSRTSDAINSTAYSLVEGLNREGLDNFTAYYYDEIVVHLRGKQCVVYASKDINKPLNVDLVYIHGFTHHDVRQFLAHYFKDKKIKFLNRENILSSPASKLNQYYKFSRNKVNYPETVVAYPAALELAAKSFNIDYPIIIKSINGRVGEDNYLVKSPQELKSIVADLLPSQAFALQPFINNQGDYRVIVYKNKTVACYLRQREDSNKDHRNNVKRGASRTLVDPVPAGIQKIAKRAAASLNRELTGVDVLIDGKGSYYVLESNFNFGLKDEGDEITPYVLSRLAVIFHKLAK